MPPEELKTCKDMAKINVPVLLLTGYLGSGKTTLLNRILSNKRGIRFAVIVNDIGEVNIDANLIQKGGIVDKQDDSLIALQNGCICCTLKMDLVQQISDIIAQQRFDYLVIEASGICEPAPIAQTICSIPSMGEPVTRGGIPVLDCIATVVDALRMKDEFQSGEGLMKPSIAEEDIENLVIQQIEFCNIILLNKASEVEPHELERIRQIIKALQPKAEIIECDYGNVELDRLLNTGLFDFERVATSAAWIDEIEHHHGDEEEEHHEHHHHEEEDEHHHEEDEHEHHHEEEHTHHHHHHHHHDEEGEAEEYGIGTFVYTRRRPFMMTEFDQFIARKFPKSVIRCKGLCYFAEEKDMCYVFEQAGSQVSLRNAGQWYATMPKDELEEFKKNNPWAVKDWDPEYGDRMQKLVFIGQDMNRKEIEKQLDECLL